MKFASGLQKNSKVSVKTNPGTVLPKGFKYLFYKADIILV